MPLILVELLDASFKAENCDSICNPNEHINQLQESVFYSINLTTNDPVMFATRYANLLSPEDVGGFRARKSSCNFTANDLHPSTGQNTIEV